MTVNYKEEVVEGTSYVRCGSINISNPQLGDKYIQFNEERLAIINGQTVYLPLDTGLGRLNAALNSSTMQEQFPVRDPNTGELTGQILVFADVYKYLYSLYTYLANKRDQESQL